MPGPALGLLHPGRAWHLHFGELGGTEGKLSPTRASPWPPAQHRCLHPQGQLLAKSWSSLFEGQASAAPRGPIYSFNGRNVLTDPLW